MTNNITKGNKKTLGIIGIGQFAEFFIPHLKPFFSEIYITSKSNKSETAKKLGIAYSSMEEVCQQDIIMLSMPISNITSVLKEIRSKIKKNCIVFDVCSVKVFPLKEMKKILPKDAQILGTHPLFGPQSGKNGIKDLQIVLCPERIKKESYQEIKSIFKHMGLDIKEVSAKKHDEIMAYTQSLTHFFSRAAAQTIPLEDFAFTTPSAKRLKDIILEVKDDPEQLFLDMQTLNPYAAKTRNKFLKELNKLNKKICKKK